MAPTGQADRLSRALRQLSLRPGFVNFFFDGSVESEILWPFNNDKLPHWPNMRHLTVKMTGVLPSRKWVALHDPRREERWGEADLVSNSVPGEDRLPHLRGPTDLQFFDELCLAAGKAATQMPSLEHFYMGFGGGENDWSKWADTELSYELQRARHKEPSLEIRAVPMLDQVKRRSRSGARLVSSMV